MHLPEDLNTLRTGSTLGGTRPRPLLPLSISITPSPIVEISRGSHWDGSSCSTESMPRISKVQGNFQLRKRGRKSVGEKFITSDSTMTTSGSKQNEGVSAATMNACFEKIPDDPTRFRCIMCNLLVKSACKFNHYFVHVGPQFECHVCHNRYKRKDTLRDHVLTKHPESG